MTCLQRGALRAPSSMALGLVQKPVLRMLASSRLSHALARCWARTQDCGLAHTLGWTPDQPALAGTVGSCLVSLVLSLSHL